jgi:hypothetical protein
MHSLVCILSVSFYLLKIVRQHWHYSGMHPSVNLESKHYFDTYLGMHTTINSDSPGTCSEYASLSTAIMNQNPISTPTRVYIPPSIPIVPGHALSMHPYLPQSKTLDHQFAVYVSASPPPGNQKSSMHTLDSSCIRYKGCTVLFLVSHLAPSHSCPFRASDHAVSNL